jgi:hypothetical protein
MDNNDYRHTDGRAEASHHRSRGAARTRIARRWMDDSLKPWTDKGSLRINPLLVMVVVIALPR